MAAKREIVTLEEATLEDIFQELKRRFPRGVVLCGLRPPSLKSDEALMDDCPYIAWNQAMPSLGLMHIATGRIHAVIQPHMTCIPNEGDDVEDEDDE